MTEHRLDDLIREINAETFSPLVHGEGHRVVHSSNQTRLYRKSFLARLLGSRNERHYFVKHLRVPKTVKDWKFHWSEGTSAISLDFDSSFVIQANEDTQAMTLTNALAREGKPGEALHGLIAAHLHAELEQLLRKCNDKTASLLDCFRQGSIGVGESEEVNNRVSESVARALGGCLFRIGFQLRNAPPTQIEIEWPEEFTLADSTEKHKARTTALLQLVNYQAYKKSGLDSEAAIKEAIHLAISRSVQQLLFGRKYYDVVQSFRRKEASVESLMRERIEQEALSIGYRVSMFQTFPDIAALELLEWKRIEMEANQGRYSLKYSTSDVQVAVDLSVRAEGGFDNMHLLVRPDDKDVVPPIKERVAQICRDTLQNFDWQEFNLEFEQRIKPLLQERIESGLRSCGLSTHIIRIAPVATADASRFKALRGRTTAFQVTVSQQANVGSADPVIIRGKVEVTGMSPTGWGNFEAKDFGFRADSRVSETSLRQQAASRGLTLPETAPLSQEVRNSVAVELELLEIRDRAVSTLTEAMSKVRDLAAKWRSIESSSQIVKWAEDIATAAVEKEFGLKIALRGVARDNTATEATAQMRQLKANDLARALLDQDVARATEVRKVTDQHELAMLTDASAKDQEALADESHSRHAQLRDNAAARLAVNPSEPRLTAESLVELLEQPEPETSQELPWLPTADTEKNAKGTIIDGGSR